jgi:uncharacterized 2Fe-2S/4Fe-4S cluster protein (DUF4445 family)
MPTLTLYTHDKPLQFQGCPQQSVLDLLDQAHIKISTACAGNGFCGLCRIQLLAGQGSALTSIEQHKLSAQQLEQGTRLACQVQLVSDLTIKVENALNTLAWRVLSHLDRTALQPQEEYGLALDLGTTQLRLSVWNLTQQRRVMAWLAFNPQYRFGADILSRLTVALQTPALVSDMSQLIQQAVKKILPTMAKLALPRNQIKKLFIVGNTPMLALLAEKNVQPLLDPAYWSQVIDCQLDNMPSWQQTLGLGSDTAIATIPPLAGFIGSDLFAGILSTGLTRGSTCGLLIDFGTNSEMALWDGRKLWVSSVPGGPAFEGCGISCGMPAGRGAISQLWLGANGWDYHVIGHSPALGLCGSGLVDVIAHLLATQQLTRNGRFTQVGSTEIRLELKDGVTLALKKQDIDIFQRAKAATGAAIVQLFKQSGMNFNDLAQVYVCGAFGKFLNSDNAQAIGLLPPVNREKVQLCEQSALEGCELLLSNPEAASHFALREQMEIVNMAYATDFDDCFVENLYLQPLKCPLRRG